MLPPAAPRTLDRRTLNRALLARQLLLRREARPIPQVIEHLVGLQAQEPGDPYVALWSRLEGFVPEELGQLLVERRAVRSPLMRATIHLVTDRDALALSPVMAPVMRRTFSSQSPFGRNLAGVDLEAVVAMGRQLIEANPRTRAELRRLLAPEWPDRDAASLAQAVTYLLPLTQIPPRGVWKRSGQATWATIETWLGQPLGTNPSPARAVLRYLAAFGPASASDVRTWSGLTGVREVLEDLRSRLRTYRDERGRELMDVPDGPMPDPETPAPVRFLPVYDNALLSHQDRSRIIDADARRRVLAAAYEGSFGTVLVDGFARATWRVAREDGRRSLRIGLVDPLPDSDLSDVADEGRRLLAFLEPAAVAAEVQFHRLSTA
ncbi:MAG TPA: winged helix DNA-binding domain-containing protein [Candidatus Binatia bacterium]|nr:winged helix DNA-binding domain-containing protein [Candidatus Binatia bacterium]